MPVESPNAPLAAPVRTAETALAVPPLAPSSNPVALTLFDPVAPYGEPEVVPKRVGQYPTNQEETGTKGKSYDWARVSL